MKTKHLLRLIEVKSTVGVTSLTFNYIRKDLLLMNSIYLMLSLGVMAFFGFVFWLINARVYPTEFVGVGTTIISTVTLISSFSLLGIGNGLIRYLPNSNIKNKKINTSFTLVGLFSLFSSLLFLLFLKVLSPELMFIRRIYSVAILFILFTVATSLNSISENVFIAYRTTGYVLIKNIIFSLLKIIFTLLFIAFGVYGIFLSFGFSISFALIVAIIILITKFGYKFKLLLDKEAIAKMFRFSLGTYLAEFIANLPALALPLVITALIGSRYSAYFYMDMMVANLVFVIPSAVSQSLFAEGSHNETDLQNHLTKAIKLISILVIPSIIFTLLFGKYILAAFGPQYAEKGTLLLQILVLSSILISVNSVSGMLLRIKHRINKLIGISTVGTVITLALSFLLIRDGLTGIGIAWLMGNLIMCALYLTILKKPRLIG